MERGDRVKYSKELMGQDEMNQLLNTALHIVEDTHMRLQEEKNATAAGKRHESKMIDFIEWNRLGLADPHWLFLLLAIPFPHMDQVQE